jgi:saccharopine dehydrogenase-like NADP-dependent oxidoreductase
MPQKTALVLGAGFVSGPLTRYLCDRGHRVLVASRTLSKAENIAPGCENAKPIEANVTDPETLEHLVSQADLVISLVPYTFHVAVAKVCLKHGKHLVTTSYVSPEMAALDAEARKAGLVLLNEIGLDPGIDHMSAMQVIDRIHAEGGKVTGFNSNCGGLPAPESNDNPFGYKFSWSPRGVVLAGRNNAQFLKEKQVVSIPGEELFDNYWPLKIDGVGEFMVYPNRDSLGYIDQYGLSGIQTMFRGTIRNPGWCKLWKKIADLGFTNVDPIDLADKTYAQLTAELVAAPDEGLVETVASFLRLDPEDEIIGKMQWLGLFSDEAIPAETPTVLDALVHLLWSKLQYKPGERDMIILQHKFDILRGGKASTILATLVDYGVPDGDSAMSRTVGLPAAIASDLILTGALRLTGVHTPVHMEIYEPVLKRLADMGLKFTETVLG